MESEIIDLTVKRPRVTGGMTLLRDLMRDEEQRHDSVQRVREEIEYFESKPYISLYTRPESELPETDRHEFFSVAGKALHGQKELLRKLEEEKDTSVEEIMAKYERNARRLFDIDQEIVKNMGLVNRLKKRAQVLRAQETKLLENKKAVEDMRLALSIYTGAFSTKLETEAVALEHMTAEACHLYHVHQMVEKLENEIQRLQDKNRSLGSLPRRS